MPTGGIYARFSPRIEQDRSYTIDNQISMCRELAAKDGVVIDEDHIYRDHAISGASDNRPQFERMLEKIWAGDFPDFLYSKDSSRLSRRGLEASWLIERIWDRGITIRYCMGDYGDPRQSADVELMHNINHVFNQHARAKKAEETRFHQKQNALAGYHNGGLAPHGYRKKRITLKNYRNESQPKVVLELDPDKAPAIEHAFRRYADGVGANTIAAELTEMGFRSQKGKPFSKTTIRSWFQNPFRFSGCLTWNRLDKKGRLKPFEEWIMVKDAFPAIISYEQADQIYKQVQARKKVARNKGLKRPSKYLLTGLIICPVCQSHFVVNGNLRKKQFHYICGTRNRVTQGCSNKIWIHLKHFEDQLMEQIEEVILQDGPLETYLQHCWQEYQKQQQETDQQIDGLQKQIQASGDRMENLLNALADNMLPAEAIKEKYGQEEIKRRQLDQRLTELKRGKNAEPLALDKFRQLLKRELQQDDSRKLALHALIERITAYPDRKMEVNFRIREREKLLAGIMTTHQSTYPLGGLPLVGVSYNYIHTWQYIPSSLRV